MFREIDGDLLKLANNFDVIAHGCNCFCKQKKGIAELFAQQYNTDTYELEQPQYKGDINKLGCIDYDIHFKEGKELIVVNCYTQYDYPKKGDYTAHLDYDAVTLCMRKMNKIFKGKRIGMPQIGAGLAGGLWNRIAGIMVVELRDCDVTIVVKK